MKLNTWKSAVIISILLILVVMFGNLGFQSIFLGEDSIYIDVPTKSSTDIYVLQESKPYDDLHLTINSISGSTWATQGVNPYSMYYADPQLGWVGTGVCKGLIGGKSLGTCCQRLGYIDYRSDSGWNVCYGQQTEYPQYIKIYVGSTQVYNWNFVNDGSYPKTSDNFADTVNAYCGLDEPMVYCTSAGYAYSNEYGKCIMYKDDSLSCDEAGAYYIGDYGADYIVCGMEAIDKSITSQHSECIVPVTFETGNNYGYLNIGLFVGNQQATGEIILAQPPVNEDNNSDVTNGGAEGSGFWSYIQQRATFINILIGLLSLVIVGGLLYVWKFKKR